MKLADYKEHLDSISFGKRLPSALYVCRVGVSFGEPLDALLFRMAAAFQVEPRHNVIKFRTGELKISFLAYENFLDDPHPVLRHAITLDLATGKHRQTDYACNPNPPILHRKETLLPPDHPRRAEFGALTRQEEQHGLYEETTTIGFKANWERLLAAKNLKIENGSLVSDAEIRSVSSTATVKGNSPKGIRPSAQALPKQRSAERLPWVKSAKIPQP